MSERALSVVCDKQGGCECEGEDVGERLVEESVILKTALRLCRRLPAASASDLAVT